MGEITAAMPQKRERIVLLDYLRGVGFIFVIWYHLMYDLLEFYGICGFILSDGMDIFRDIMVGMLVLISGICCRYSRSNIKRGVICFFIAMGLTLITGLMGEYTVIRFGILHMFGVSMLLYGLFEKLIQIKRPIWAAGVCFLGFLLFFAMQFGTLGFYRLELLELPQAWFQTPYLFWLGLPNRSFYSADYYPLFPWTLLFFTGAFFGAYADLIPRMKPYRKLAALAWTGKHTMFLYLLHQPIFYGIFYLIDLF